VETGFSEKVMLKQHEKAASDWGTPLLSHWGRLVCRQATRRFVSGVRGLGFHGDDLGVLFPDDRHR
jgi:hypothetical protein